MIHRIKNWAQRRFCKVNNSPILVFGNQKSGTTAIAKLVASSAGVSCQLDLPSMWGETQKKIYRDELFFSDFVKENRLYFSNEIIKEPCLTFLYPQINEFYENRSRNLMIVRRADENIRSILNRIQIRGDLLELENVHRESIVQLNNGKQWLSVVENEWLGVPGNDHIESLALRWNKAIDVYLENKQDFTLVRYEDFLENKVDCITQLTVDLGLTPVNSIEELVDIQYQPSGNKSVVGVDFFGKRNFEKINSICKKHLLALGYD